MSKALTISTALILVLAFSMQSHADGKHKRHDSLSQKLEKTLASNPQTFQFTNVRDITISPAVASAGGAFLIRSKNGLDARMMVADLEPGHAYTFWWIIFNRPHKCAQTPCASADLMAASGAVHYASGAVAGENGTANASFSTDSGGPPDGAIGDPSLPEAGLRRDRGFKAEVHLVMVDHGIPNLADFTSEAPDSPGTWAWELTHPLPPGPTWVRAAIFVP